MVEIPLGENKSFDDRPLMGRDLLKPLAEAGVIPAFAQGVIIYAPRLDDVVKIRITTLAARE